MEIIDGRETNLFCQFIVPFEFGNEVAGSVRWFLNELELNVQTQFPGIQLAITNREDEGGEGIDFSSTLTVLATVALLPPNLVNVNGRITCFLDNEPNPFGLFNTIIVSRTG